jgi:hypothetical protein
MLAKKFVEVSRENLPNLAILVVKRKFLAGVRRIKAI